MKDEIKPDEWIPASEAFRPKSKPRPKPQIDKDVSNLVGQPVNVNDSRLIKVIASINKTRDPNDLAPYDYLENASNREKIKNAFR